ncbi:MAG: PQQ-binding-like beta-propeller repeat protein [Verrucomicrobia bacterium]|nr:PQQ-binding-like beta-propeller repeat protein [Verrucomicrobiota bacterium]
MISARVCAAGSGEPPAASEWARFRGPNGSGHSSATDLPTTWSEKDYRWKVRLPGTGHASPVIWDEKIFLACGDNATAKRILICLNTSDGRPVWRREYESAEFSKNRDNSYASSTAAVDRDRVYFYWTTEEEVTVLALDHAGQQVWRRNLGPYKSQHGSGTSPIVFQDLVIVNNDQEGPSSLLALDAKTGATRWKVDRRTDRAAYSTPCVRQTEAGKLELLFASSGHGITGVDPQTGRTNWELSGAFPFRVVGSLVLAEGLIVGACGEGGIGRRVVGVRPPAGDRGPELVYEMKSSIPYVPSPIYRSGLVFLWGDNGLVVCLRAATGERVWQRKISDRFYSSPICAGERLYCVSRTGIVYVLAATDKDELIASVPLGEPAFATPAVAAGTLYFRTASHLICLPSHPAGR